MTRFRERVLDQITGESGSGIKVFIHEVRVQVLGRASVSPLTAGISLDTHTGSTSGNGGK